MKKKLENIDELIEQNLEICSIKGGELWNFEMVGLNKEPLHPTIYFTLSKIMEQNGLIDIDKDTKRRIDITALGYEVLNNGGWLKYKQIKKEKEEIEFKKLKTDLTLAEKTLKEFPKTKWFARIGLLIGIISLILSLIQLLNK